MQQAWDKNGKIYYIDDNGNRVQPKTTKNAFERLGMQAKAGLGNLNRWLQNADTNSQSYKDKANLTLGLLTIPIGGSSVLAQKGASALTPFVGRKIAQSVASGAVGGATGGAVEGFGRGLIENKNPLQTMLQDSAIGLVGGSAVGGIVGKAGQALAKRGLPNNPAAQKQYFADYVEGLSNNTPINKVSRFQKALGDFKLAKEGSVKGGNSKEFLFAGENALNADINALNKAKEMFDNGIDNETIRQNTGWFKGVDDKWRFEMDDGDVAIKEHFLNTLNDRVKSNNEMIDLFKERGWDEKIPEYLDDNNQTLQKIENFDKIFDTNYIKNYGGFSTKLPNLYKNDTLYSAYPELANTKVHFVKESDPNTVAYFNTGKGLNGVVFNTNYKNFSLDNLKGTFSHELQHAIQDIEDFATGGGLNEKGGLNNQYRLIRNDGIEKQKINALPRLKEVFPENYQQLAEDLANYEYYFNNNVDRPELPILDNLSNEDFDKANKIFTSALDKENESLLSKIDKLQNLSDFDVYQRLAGEAEARLASKRAFLKPEQRKEYSPFLDKFYGFDVEPEKQIVKFGNDGLYQKLIDNYNPEIEQIAKDYFGLTNNTKEAGYILNDGSLLDLSGKKFGGSAGSRSMDHREIVDAFLDNPNNANNLEIGFDEFIDNGAVRYMPESNTFFLAKMPSENQIQSIKNLLNKNNGESRIELVPKVAEWGHDNNFKRDYAIWSDPNKIIDDIRTYFKGGKISDFKDYL